MSHFNILGFKPQFYWDETHGLKPEKPMLVKLVQSDNLRSAMPGKCPSVFAETIGYALPCHWQSLYVLWRVIPAGIELRQNTLIFTPAGKGSPIRAVRPKAPEQVEEMPTETELRKPKPKEADEQEEVAGTGDPSFVVKYQPLPLNDNSPPASPVGVTFLTKRHNHRLVWNVIPSGETLAKGVLILDPWVAPEEESPAKHWWQRG